MRYMLLMKGSQTDWQVLATLPPADLARHLAFMTSLDRQLEASGELVSAQGLAAPGQARMVRAGSDGTAAVTGAPFAEAQELLAGCWVVDCESPARATAIAARISAAPGRDGAPLNLPVEVRQVMSAPGEEM